jgi:hypothetical protein
MQAVLALIALVVSTTAFAAEPATPAKPHAGMRPELKLTQTAKVLSTLKAPPYTYIEASQGKNTIWLASNAIAVKAGDVIRFDEGMVMNDFYSKSLKRTFPSILFVNKVVVGDGK